MKVFAVIGYVLKALSAGVIAGGATYYSGDGNLVAAIGVGLGAAGAVFLIPNGPKPGSVPLIEPDPGP